VKRRVGRTSAPCWWAAPPALRQNVDYRPRVAAVTAFGRQGAPAASTQMPSHHSRMRQPHGNQLGAPHQHKPCRVFGPKQQDTRQDKNSGRSLGDG